MIQFDEHIFHMGWNHQLVLEWPRVEISRVIVGQTPD